MKRITDTQRPHGKGVAGTSNEWKVTYVTYESASGREPALYYVIQRQSVGADPGLKEFNRTLYQTIDQGGEVRAALAAVSSGR